MTHSADRRQPLVTVTDIEDVPPAATGGAIAIGNFDGVHRGHAVLLRNLVGMARARGVPAVVLTFEPHPRTFFRPESPVFRLTPANAKARLMMALGIDHVAVARFDRAFAEIEAVDFVDSVVVGRLAATAVVVGRDFHFGRRRQGTPGLLHAEGARRGFDVTVIAPVCTDDGASVSSSTIRDALAAGDIAAANRDLGYRWFVIGTVVSGERRGRRLGFPTANIALAENCRLRHGIYAVKLTVGRETFDGVASFGRRPTFGEGAPLLEVFVFDFSGDLYGREATVAFIAWIRPEERFPGADQLVAAMHEDVAAARRMLAATGPGSALDRALAEGDRHAPVVAGGHIL